ncbi:hypothetical protein LTR78_007942 [Recurvomyces mirabilis]|uniref:DASH complex subunit SPC34 n=1 Tax=Recurvomyces mirabilis TaxID=574656 RepID=A0AAE0TV52_9PEZI|nr:hypothetical protein LTR78_007942 [Recurvomyces mirabilis]KAK5152478.1 hypothetical protein LTS14_008425 [Recurvomyces mirabilis]
MPSLLTSHLDQISLCAQSISDLPFPAPKIFTNALLANHDITALIRDTEAHERALFHLAPPAITAKAADFTASVASLAPTASTAAARRATTYGAARQPKSRAVAAVLGGDLFKQTRDGTNNNSVGRQKGEVDVDVLLEGAEKLAAVYPIPGATDRIAELRQRHQQLLANIAHYEDRVSRNTQELQLMNRPTSRTGYGREDDGHEVETGNLAMDVDQGASSTTVPLTKDDLRQEEEEIRELERKKRGLEERVTGMERDLGGLAR